MKMLINFLMCFIFFISFSLYPLSYDSAAYTAQGGKWNDAYAQLNAILVDSPDRADVLYDAGVAACNLEHWDQAVACFARAAEYADDKNLRFRSHFNAGNALVAQKNLHAALEQYEKALALDPADEYARHNYDRVKEMLEQQKQEQQQQKNDQQHDDQKKDQDKKDQDNKEQEEKNQSQDKQNQSNNNKNDQQNNDQEQDQQNDSSEGNSSENDSNKESNGNERDKAQNGSNNTQRKDHGNKEQNQKQSANNQQGDGNHQPEEQSHNKNDKSDTQHGDKHKKTPEKQSNNSDNTSVAPENGQEQAKDREKDEDQQMSGIAQRKDSSLEALAKSDPWLLAVLENQEASDKATNKRLMEAKIHQRGGKNEQNCW